MAPTFVVACTTTRRHCAPQLNSGVRLFGNIHVDFKQHMCSKSDSVLPAFKTASRNRRWPRDLQTHSVSGMFKATSRRSKALIRRGGSGQCQGPVLQIFLAIHALADQAPTFGYNRNSIRPQPNKSFKLTSLRGTRFCGSVYHNAAPLRSAT